MWASDVGRGRSTTRGSDSACGVFSCFYEYQGFGARSDTHIDVGNVKYHIAHVIRPGQLSKPLQEIETSHQRRSVQCDFTLGHFSILTVESQNNKPVKNVHVVVKGSIIIFKDQCMSTFSHVKVCSLQKTKLYFSFLLTLMLSEFSVFVFKQIQGNSEEKMWSKEVFLPLWHHKGLMFTIFYDIKVSKKWSQQRRKQKIDFHFFMTSLLTGWKRIL